MSKTASEIVDRALSLIDEVPTSFTTAATTETSIRDQALEILPEVCRDLIKELPWDLKKYLAIINTPSLDVLSGGEDQDDYYKKKIAYILPDDYWELVSMKLISWSMPATKYIYIGSKEYVKENNPFTRSGKQNPAVAISKSNFGTGTYRIECFSVLGSDSSAIDRFEYISFDNVPDDAGNDWPDELFDEVTKALAAQLHIIKSRINEATIKGEEITNAIDQHK